MLTALSAAEMAAAPNEAKAETVELKEMSVDDLENSTRFNMDAVSSYFTSILKSPRFEELKEKVIVKSEFITVSGKDGPRFYPEISVSYNGDVIFRQRTVKYTDSEITFNSFMGVSDRIYETLNLFEKSGGLHEARKTFDLIIDPSVWEVMARYGVNITSERLMLPEEHLQLGVGSLSRTVEILKQNESDILVRGTGDNGKLSELVISHGRLLTKTGR